MFIEIFGRSNLFLKSISQNLQEKLKPFLFTSLTQTVLKTKINQHL